jgi:putative membrane protein (TIGR04086 family)
VSRIDVRAVAAGAALAIAVSLPATLLVQALARDDADETPGWVLFFVPVIFAGFVLGGMVAGSRQPDTPFTHGAVAALSAYLVVQSLGIALIAARGDELRPAIYVFNAFLAAALGTLGGVLAERRTSRGGVRS